MSGEPEFYEKKWTDPAPKGKRPDKQAKEPATFAPKVENWDVIALRSAVSRAPWFPHSESSKYPAETVSTVRRELSAVATRQSGFARNLFA